MGTITVAGGENEIIVVSGANDTMTEKEIEGTFADEKFSAKMLIAQLEMKPFSNNLLALKLAKSKGMTTVLNTAPAPTGGLKEIAALLEFTDILVPNEVEL